MNYSDELVAYWIKPSPYMHWIEENTWNINLSEERREIISIGEVGYGHRR